MKHHYTDCPQQGCRDCTPGEPTAYRTFLAWKDDVLRAGYRAASDFVGRFRNTEVPSPCQTETNEKFRDPAARRGVPVPTVTPPARATTAERDRLFEEQKANFEKRKTYLKEQK